MIDSTDAPWPSVGRVNVAGFRRTFMCTGTLIAPRLVLTAAHCLFSRISGKPFRPEEVIFLAGVRRETFSARMTADCFKIHKAYRPERPAELKNLYSDVAMIVLKQDAPLAIVPQMPDTFLTTAPKQARLASAGYHSDRRFLPTFDPSCSIIGEVSGSWLTDCASKHGASGGPVFMHHQGEMKIAAIMSATAGSGTSVVVPSQQWKPLLAAPECPPEEDALLDAASLAPDQEAGTPGAPPLEDFALRPSIAPSSNN